MKRIILSSVLVLVFGVVARAQDPAVRIVFEDGLVTLKADNALKSEVLAEWERVGGTTVKGLDRLPAERITISLAGAHERTALDAVLGATGYVSTLRADLFAAKSLLRTIVVVPRSTAAPAARREVDMSMPEARYAFPGETEEEAEYIRAVLESMPPPPARPAKPQDLLMPELRFHFPDPPSEPETEPEPAPKPQPKPKPPSVH